MEFGKPNVYAQEVAMPEDARMGFIRRTYVHLAGAILLFVLLSFLVHDTAFARDFTFWAFGKGAWNWLIVLGLFMAVGWGADKMARSNTSQWVQYLGLGLYAVAEAIIFIPLLYIAGKHTNPDVIPTAGLITITVFVGLTGTVFLTKKDFTFLGGILRMGIFIALGLILASLLIGFNLGVIFAGFMVALMAGYILYQTSQLQRHWNPDQHVSAALALFASVATMFYYVIIFVMEMTGSD